MLKGNEHYYNKEYREAIEYYEKALEIDPRDANALNNKGVVHSKENIDVYTCTY